MAQNIFEPVFRALLFKDIEAARAALTGIVEVWHGAPDTYKAVLTAMLRQPANRAVLNAVVDWHHSLWAERKATGGPEHARQGSQEALLAGMIRSLMELREIHADAGASATAAEIDAHEDLLLALQREERVHSIADVETLRHTRLAPSAPPEDAGVWDKRCFGLFLPGSAEPAVVIYAHLADREAGPEGRIEDRDLAGDVVSLLWDAPKPVRRVTNVTFYSVSNFKGVRGIRMLDELVHRLIETFDGRIESPGIAPIDTLVEINTLSPMKQFREWLTARLQLEGDAMFTLRERAVLQDIVRRRSGREASGATDAFLQLEELGMLTHEASPDALAAQDVLRNLGIRYLMEAKDPKKPLQALDGAADSHWGIGAYTADVKPCANLLPDGIEKSLGQMANHVYQRDIPRLLRRAAEYEATGKVTLAPPLRRLYEMRQKELARDERAKAPDAARPWTNRSGDGNGMALTA